MELRLSEEHWHNIKILSTREIYSKPKNKETLSAPLVGEVSNLAGAECLINSKHYYKHE